MGRGQLLLDLGVAHDAALGGVDQEHATGLQAAFLHDGRRVDVHNPYLGGHDHQVVVGHPVAGRAQAIAVEHCPDEGAVAEHDVGRAVPRLHQRGVVAIERSQLWRHRLVVLPRFGDHHEHRLGQRVAAHEQQLQHLVEAGGVANPLGAYREQPLQVAGQMGRAQQGLTGPHPVAVALHRVYLAVVGDKPVGMGQRPRREGVGGEPRVDHGQGAGYPGVAQIGVELAQLRGGEHPLVDDGPVGQAGEVAIGQLAGLGPQRAGIGLVVGFVGDLVSDPGANDIGPSHQRIGVQTFAGIERLPERRHGGQRTRSQLIGAGGHLPPSQRSQPFLGGDLVHGCPGMSRGFGSVGKEADAGCVGSRLRQVEVADLAVELVGHLDQQARPITRIDFCPQCPPVLEAAQRAVADRHDLVARPALQVHQEPDPASIMLVSGVVEALRVWQFGGLRRPVPHCVLSSVFAMRAKTALASGRVAILPPQPGSLPSLLRATGGVGA